MADRKLSAAQGIAKAKPHIKNLKRREEAALADVAGIRAQVKEADLNAFDETLDELVNGKQ